MIERLTAAVRELGAPNGLLYLCDQALMRLSPRTRLHRYRFVAVPVHAPADEPPRQRPGFVVRRLEPGDPAFAEMPLTEDVLEFRFAQPTLCFGAFMDGALVGYLWLCVGPYQEDEVRCRFVPQPREAAVWDFDFYIVPAFRNSRAFARLWAGAHRYLWEHGYVWSVSRISAYNRASVASHERMGARFLGSATFLCLGPVQVMIASVPPYLRASVLGRAQPVLRLDVS